ncbi:hypothetical protein [Baekduia sp.]|jgi:hypothetical protein|uniref:hypothetical protein n=1 Tax=Baekduia sp. TaxID=2600305 RepID=UPI002E02F1DF|nr:hypothetical protein [Baekduia sp.]
MHTHNTRVIARTVLLAALLAVAFSSVARANFGIDLATGRLTTADGLFSRQAGEHADINIRIALPRTADNVADGSVHDVKVDLPVGLVGNPTAAPTCDFDQLIPPGGSPNPDCPIASQVGIAKITTDSSLGPDDRADIYTPVFNMRRSSDSPGLFAFNFGGAALKIVPRVRPDDYGIGADSLALTQASPPYYIDVTLWGVPADPAHNSDREDPAIPAFGASSPDPRKAFLSNPTSCSGKPAAFTVSADAWQDIGAFVSKSFDQDRDGTPFVFTGCDRVPFNPSVNVQPLSHTADAPTGLNFDLDVPQSDAPDGNATAHMRKAVVTFPEGMSVSPSSAAGLGACAPSEVKLGNNEDVTCPNSSKIGTVEIDTPVLDEPLKGDVILAKQNDNPFRSLLALYIVAKGPGFWVKLSGRVDVDPVTGRVTTTFDNNPQLPFSHLHVALRGGSQAPLATPPACGTYTTRTEITSWASDTPVTLDTPFTIDERCGTRGFSPSLSAGTTNPLAGAESPFSLTLTRADGEQYFQSIETALPPGLLGKIAAAPECASDLAAIGACPLGTELGETNTLSGPGGAPLALNGRVYLTGPYKDAPFGLSIVVPTAGQAGPFDLGDVVVRAAIYVDRTDAHVTVKSDPLPTIIQGIPLRVRQINVTIDRAGFLFNPTACAPSTVFVNVGSLEGATASLTAPFRVAGCAALAIKQRLAVRLTGKTQTTDGKHPGISATLTDSGGGANLRKVVAKLPLSLALDPDNAQALCKPEQRLARACPATSIVGQARATSVLLDALTGPVYFVEAKRRSASGRLISTFPNLWIPLSADGVTIDITATSAVDSLDRLVTTFDMLPDAPISTFQLSIDGGKHGIITVSGKPGVCDRSRVLDLQLTGQSGKVMETPVTATVDGCKPKIKKASASPRAVSLRLSGVGAGRLTLTGGSVVKSTRTLKAATEATIKAQLTSKARATLRHVGRLRVAVTVKFTPHKGAGVTLHRLMRLRR